MWVLSSLCWLEIDLLSEKQHKFLRYQAVIRDLQLNSTLIKGVEIVLISHPHVSLHPLASIDARFEVNRIGSGAKCVTSRQSFRLISFLAPLLSFSASSWLNFRGLVS